MTAWTVARTEDDGPWEIRADGQLIEAVRAHYGVREVLDLAEQIAGRSLLWRLDDADGFVSA